MFLGGGFAHDFELLPHVTLAPVASEWIVPMPKHDDEPAVPVSLKVQVGNYPLASAARPTTSIIDLPKLGDTLEWK